jgi:hypothetical protein
VEIRRVGRDEWGTLRVLRLRALQDAPDAFGSTYEEESSRTDAEWMGWAADLADGGSSFGVVADDGSWLAMAVGAPHRDHPGEAGLFAMWVAPDARHADRSHPRRTGCGLGAFTDFPAPAPGDRDERRRGGSLHAVRILGYREASAPPRGSDIITMSMTLDLST